ncbi:MAG TPA: calcium/sodium antiporter [Bacteroidales bacterium]|nr:calcium/sodium antiporter [Bacteroidales bacterium]
MIVFVLFVIGFVLLVYGANFLVDGAASFAKKKGLSNVVIGLTIVAMGTSTPELVVNVIASMAGADDVAMGNVLGSNIANILLILGISSAIYPLVVKVNHKWKKIPFALEVPIAIAGAIIIGILANEHLIFNTGRSEISRINGLVLVAFFLGYLFYSFKYANHGPDEEVEVKDMPVWRSIVLIPLGIGAMALGGSWIVDGAVKIAEMFDMSEAIISLTIVAVGTSLPELATSVAAAIKKNAGIAVGNIVGSNIFNVFFILGISTIVNPIDFNPVMNFDILVALFTTVILFVFLFLGRRNVLERWQGVLLVILYVFYVTALIFQETGAINMGF